MDVIKTKPPLASPTFEKLNLERLKQSEENTETARRAVSKSAELVDHSKEIVRQLRNTRRKAR